MNGFKTISFTYQSFVAIPFQRDRYAESEKCSFSLPFSPAGFLLCVPLHVSIGILILEYTERWVSVFLSVSNCTRKKCTS